MGGPIMSNPISVYVIWYGRAPAAGLRTAVATFVSNLGGSAYWGVTAAYYHNATDPTRVSESITLAGSVVTHHRAMTEMTNRPRPC